MMRIFRKYLLIPVVLTGLFVACQTSHPPKPRGYFRIELPEKEYRLTDTILPCNFELPQYAFIRHADPQTGELAHVNVEFPRFQATIYLSYRPLENNLYELLEDNRKLAFKHTIKAEAINERLFSDPQKHTHGILFEIKGNAASPLQFYLTDSTKHFLRGSLYFNNIPNKDSLAPVIGFLEKDMTHLMETLNWKNQ